MKVWEMSRPTPNPSHRYCWNRRDASLSAQFLAKGALRIGIPSAASVQGIQLTFPYFQTYRRRQRHRWLPRRSGPHFVAPSLNRRNQVWNYGGSTSVEGVEDPLLLYVRRKAGGEVFDD